MKVGVFLLVLVAIRMDFAFSKAIIRDKSEVVFPERIHVSKSKRDLSTRNGESHEEFVKFLIKTKEKIFILDLKRHSGHHTNEVILLIHDDAHNLVEKKISPDSCFYHGTVKGLPDSEVFLSTCNGLTGSIHDGTTRLDIEPNLELLDGSHTLYEVEDEVSRTLHHLSQSCGSHLVRTKDVNDYQLHTSSESDAPPVHYRSRRELINTEPQYAPFLTVSYTRYVELFLLADHGIYLALNNDTSLVTERLLNALSQVDKSYQAINIRLVVKAIQIHTKGDLSFTRNFTDGASELYRFRDYYATVMDKLKVDNGMFLSRTGWPGLLGYALVGGMCRSASVSINYWTLESISEPTTLLGHELGHNLNFLHDTELVNCTCLTSRGCFMGDKRSSRPGFTDCNLRRLAEREFACINNYPTGLLSRVCGNGLIEEGEECDCGTPENCAKKDPCCNPLGCTLKSHAQCSDFSTPQCCASCMFKPHGTECRPPNGNCDVAEYCTGQSPVCPEDLSMRDGIPCSDTLQVIVGNSDGRVVEQRLTPKIHARYIRLNPVYWKNGAYACLRTEFYGCPANQDETTYPTAIATEDLYYTAALCLFPDVSSCAQVVEGTPLKFKLVPNKDCSKDYMMFTYQADKTLVHTCSGLKVCQVSSTNFSVVLSSKCAPADARYERTESLSLRQLSTGRCVRAADSWPNDNDLVTLSTSCVGSSDIALLLFLRHDCLQPLGMMNGNIPDQAITSSRDNAPSSNAKASRLNVGSSWCAPFDSVGQDWLQVDLGQMYKVRAIETQGTSYHWVTGYHVFYSEDGKLFQGYLESGLPADNSFCYQGQCARRVDRQCTDLWSVSAKQANDVCWNSQNAAASDFGTCSPTAKLACDLSNVFCGQIQCSDPAITPYRVNYGHSYVKQEVQTGVFCNLASILGSAEVGLGMVADGTKCGDNKMCKSQKCLSFSDLGILKCPVVDGQECSGRGVCNSAGKCHCSGDYSTESNCGSLSVPINGGWGSWTEWSKCDKSCNGGKSTRSRFCDAPFPKYGGSPCLGSREESRSCNTEVCPAARSCKDLKIKLEARGVVALDGVYDVTPASGSNFEVFCDMTRNGGGWTLVVSSHSNTWTVDNVRLRNALSPSLYADYSILQHADLLKDTYRTVQTFQYRLEAHDFGRWGGIWEAPSIYQIDSTNRFQTNVKLIQQFDEWTTAWNSLGGRVPYVSKHKLTTVDNSTKSDFGTITDNKEGLHPAAWINEKRKMEYPEHIWYWMREGDYLLPRSCLEVMFRGFEMVNKLPSGVYEIEPSSGKRVSTFCDFDRYGGGWTLLLARSTSAGWTSGNVLSRRKDSPSLTADFSVLEIASTLKSLDVAENSFQYILEANGNDKDGGIFSVAMSHDFMCSTLESPKPVLLNQFGTWNLSQEQISKRAPCVTNANGVYLTVSENPGLQLSGSLVADSSATGASYMTSVTTPTIVRLWMREGGSFRSCNEIRVKGLRKGKTLYKDGFYMIRGNRPVYCDMESNANEGWTLLVSSASSGWSASQVMARNEYSPSLNADYSILGQAQSIKELSNGATFRYKLDAQVRNRYGGVWQAPIDYRFDYTSSNYPTTLVSQFDPWINEWWRGPGNRMPWLGTPSKGKALLTAASADDTALWGTIISNDTDGRGEPSPWLVYVVPSPGHIWYWLNENDCDSDYKPVHGGLSAFSHWTPCSSYCNSGVQTRYRACNSPKPRCAGDPCVGVTHESQACRGACAVSTITSGDGALCVRPQSGGCSPADDTLLVLRNTGCDGADAQFIFDRSRGTLTHKCSGKPVCPLGGSATWLTDLVVSARCPSPSSYSQHFLRTFSESLNYDTLYVGPSSNVFADGKVVELRGSVTNKLKLLQIVEGAVRTAYWDKILTTTLANLTGDLRFPNSPTVQGFLDNMDSPLSFADNYGLRMWSYFVAPATGDYRFVAACDDVCQVWLGTSTDTATKQKIIEFKGWAGRYQWDKWPEQKSISIRLSVGVKYYLEGLLVDGTNGDHLSIGVDLPDGTLVRPITHEYLSSSAA